MRRSVSKGEPPADDIKFTDEKVCKSFIMGLCPHALFNNTKMDIGDCRKVHSAALKADYEAASKSRSYGYELDQMEHLQAFIKECDRKIVLAKKRLAETQDDFGNTPEAQAVHELGEKIGKKLAEAEALGAEGKVDESLQAMAEVEELKNQKRTAEEVYRDTLPSSSLQQQKLRVCEVCAAYLSLYDNDRRLADHFGGKLHMGFIKIRDRLKELEDEVEKKREAREMERAKRQAEREKDLEDRRRKDRNGDRDRRRDRSRDRDRDRGRDRDRDRRGRDDRRDSNNDRSRRDRRSRSRERRRSRSRERRRSRSRERRRDRSRSRSKSNPAARRERSPE
ncbi:putative RNA-binding protein Luc7-like 2 isoform X2 [Dendronephthya gigantea]|uniref:putative RNA-binding protein Luc7-like 2 isoform X2 n=1 Tax=Dendronephthya gigantea TaxID=151771 RepID=UPI00106A36AF|nr:putative RNA-binding protein Luc7-like 2 isoform X2 [Dendronephthya gigantea]